MSEEWLIALGLVLVLEGLLPTLAPKSWKKMVSDMASRSDGQLRAVGLVMMIVGLVWVFLVI
ncbi:DUF2065 domain-containing protein [Kangiella spongicola]|uniref:DUF2065 domain-containing protein n=1 Tax=Kangiella spongicola TaxID=796379 RepID=A0A318D2H4_9GAMM|nr:DUF2065 family protein [Kangiella spongicola]MBV36002.1 DUF2065 domain-containing protein [Rickettsiales bacterium]PXF63436.1 DUF2065 domain-containing protein [Kangiella spongicola]